MGLDWNADVKAGQLEKLCQLQSLKALQAELQKRLPGDIVLVGILGAKPICS